MRRVRPVVFAVALAGSILPAAARDGAPDLPELAFLGAFGATVGAGSFTGGDASGGGADNPAALALGTPGTSGAPGWSVAAAGYAPFGLEDLHVAEVAVVRAGTSRAAGIAVRALLDEHGPDAARWTVRAAWKTRRGVRAGLAVRGPVTSGASGRFGTPGGVAGLLWTPHAALAMGAIGSFDPSARAPCAGLGADAGGRLGAGYELRMVVDYQRCFDAASAPAGPGWRVGARLRLHASLSVHAGYAPRPRTAGLGIRFGLGDWDVFTALRRHAALGSTAVQGVRWSLAKEGNTRERR